MNAARMGLKLTPSVTVTGVEATGVSGASVMVASDVAIACAQAAARWNPYPGAW